MTDLQRVSAEAKTPSERQLKIKNIFVGHDRFREASVAVRRSHYPVEGGAPDFGRISILAGESRVGKTYVATKYAKSHPAIVSENGMLFPVAFVDVPMEGKRGLLEAMADALQLRHSLSVNSAGLLSMILRALLDHKVELLFFDEVQTILKEGNRQMIAYARHLFRKILNLNTLNIVCIGLEETYDLMAADPQLSGRGLRYTIVRPYSWENLAEQQSFRLLCDEFDRLLPFNAQSKLGSQWLAHRLFYATDGNIGRLKNFLYDAGCDAINDGTEAIEVRHFTTAYDRIKRRGVDFNPFTHDLSQAPTQTVGPEIFGSPRDIFQKKTRRDAVN